MNPKEKLKGLAMPIMANYYDILGVPLTANADEIKSAYRRLAMQLHPDRNAGESEQFHLVNKAYSTLADPQKKAQYDLHLKTPLLNGPTTLAQAAQADELSVAFIEEMAQLTKSLIKQGQSKAFILGALHAKGAPAKIANKLYEATHSRYRAQLTGLPAIKARLQERKAWLAIPAVLGLAMVGAFPLGQRTEGFASEQTGKGVTTAAPATVTIAQSQETAPKQSPLILKTLPQTAEFEAGRAYFENKPLELTLLKTLEGPEYNETTELYAAKPAQGQDYDCENCSVLLLTKVTNNKKKLNPDAPSYKPLAFFGGYGHYNIPKQSARFISYGINRRALTLHDSYKSKGTELEMVSLFDLKLEDPLLGVVFLKEDNLRSAECKEQRKCQNYRAQFGFDNSYEDIWPLQVRIEGLLSSQNEQTGITTNEVHVVQTWLLQDNRYKPVSQVNLLASPGTP